MHSRNLLVVFSIMLAVALMAAACGKSSAIPSARGSLASFDSSGGGAGSFSDSDFTIESFDDKNPDPSQQGRLTASVIVEKPDGNVVVAVDAADASYFKSALLHLNYDSSIFSPLRVTQGDFLESPIFLSVTNIPGVVAIGSILTNPLESEGAFGKGRIATVEFKREPFLRQRRSSAVPNNADNKIMFASVLDDPVNKEVTIIFTEKNLGNYDLADTEVMVADITPIALNYLQNTTTGNPADDPMAVIDGDDSEDIGISDITPIAVNYLNSVEAYSIRWGIDDTAAPSAVSDQGQLPNLEDGGAPYSCSRHYSGDGLAPRYAYTFDYGANPNYTGADGAALRFWIRPYGEEELGIEGGPFSTAGGPGPDAIPPIWQSGYGIISAEYNETIDAVNITFGEAQDADSSPVVYVAYWQDGDTLDYTDALANNRFKILDISGQTNAPFTATLTAADGLTLGGNVSVGVHARDSASPYNETAAYDPHPFNPGGLDWIVADPSALPGDDTTPPIWQSGFGIIGADYSETNDAVDITFGKAQDADSSPVVYVAYWQSGDTLDYADALANNRYVILDITGQTDPPFTATLTAADGLTLGENMSIGVHARDSADPYNETAALDPHPFNPGGLDWIVAVPGTPPTDDPPVWGATIGITEADPGNTQVTVGWGNAFHPDGAPSFEVYWMEGDYSADGAAFFASANHFNVVSGNQADVTELTNDTLYSFGVRAKSPQGTMDANSKVLTATPQASVFPFQLPATDDDYDCGVVSNDSDIVLTPIDNAPVIVYTCGGAKLMAVCYYNGTDWVHETVTTSGYMEHPSIEIIGNTLIVSAYNRQTKAIELYTGDVNAQNWVLDTVDTESLSGAPLQYCYTASMEYEPVSNTIGIVYDAGVNSTKSILKYAFKIGAGNWTTEVVKDGAGYEDAPGASFVFTPSGEPSIAFTFGDFDADALIYDCFVQYATRDAGTWTVTQIPGSWQATQPIFLNYNTVTDMPFIIFGRDRFIDLGIGQDQPVTDAVIAWKDETGTWTDQVLEEGDAYFDGANYYVQLAGADPVIGFNAAGQGFLYYSFIDVTSDLMSQLIYSKLTGSTFNGVDWNYPTRIDEFGLGCSAINMAIDVSEPRLSYQRIGVLDDPPAWNEFPSGELIYHQM